MGEQKGKLNKMETMELRVENKLPESAETLSYVPIMLPRTQMAMLEICSHFNPVSYPC